MNWVDLPLSRILDVPIGVVLFIAAVAWFLGRDW
jgi:hypothetical protein